MRKKLFALLLSLVMCLGLMPLPAAAETNLPDWYFLFAAFKNIDADVKDKNGKTQHVKYSMPQEEVDLIRFLALEFEEYMNSVGVIRAHVEVVEIDQPVTELYSENKDQGSYLRAEQAAPLLKGKVDLDRYDHVTCFTSLTVGTGYAAITPPQFENGTGLSSVNWQTLKYFQDVYIPQEKDWFPQAYVHEFLHFGEYLNVKWGGKFILHRGEGKTHYTKGTDNWKTYATDAILNRINEPDVFPEGGTGIHPAVWQYPPHVLRTMTELTIPSGVAEIGSYGFSGFLNLKKVTIPGSVTEIGNYAFYNCTNLNELILTPGVTSIGRSAFRECSALTRVTIPASVTNIGEIAFWNTGVTDVYYGGTEAQWNAIQMGEYNEKLTRANIHYNHLMADVRTTDWFAKPVTWAVEQGVTSGTGEGKFSPNSTCTQAQILTFLWRAYGSPEPTGKVNGSEYYAVPIQWAVEQKLVDGSLSAKDPCTRADVVTYLWKLAGSPSGKAASFSDVPASASYAGAVNWAVEKGVTSGTSETTFSPEKTCTRGQIVTFLYAALAR